MMTQEPDKTTADPVVSFNDEPLIVVNADDEVIGYEAKDACHDGEGILHRAFSVFLFDGSGRVLLQKRAAGKRLWPQFWSNGCCSHPRRGESVDEAAERRVKEELNVSASLQYLFKFVYRVPFEDKGSEHELCAVYVGRHDGNVQVNHNEIAEWKFVDVEEFDRDLAEHADRYTPWLKMEWTRMRAGFWPTIEGLWRS